MRKDLVLTGFGHVGREFVKLLNEKHEYILRTYDFDFRLVAVGGKKGFIADREGLDLTALSLVERGSDALMAYAENNRIPLSPTYGKADALIEATPTNTDTGEPGFSYMMSAIERQMDIVAISKGALVRYFGTIFDASATNGVEVKFSGATAAALPTMDIGQISLAGAEITSIEGILNGTSNYILTCMQDEQLSYSEALKRAQAKGIAETNPRLDVEGIDSACKILLLSNSLLDTRYSLSDVSTTGIVGLTAEEILEAKAQGLKIKLIARAHKHDGAIRIEVSPQHIGPDHLLASVDGTNKGIVFHTDSMGAVGAVGGSSSPRGAAAAALKDLINLYNR